MTTARDHVSQSDIVTIAAIETSVPMLVDRTWSDRQVPRDDPQEDCIGFEVVDRRRQHRPHRVLRQWHHARPRSRRRRDHRALVKRSDRGGRSLDAPLAGEAVERLARHVVLRHLALELDAVGTVSGHGPLSFESPAPRSIARVSLSAPRGALHTKPKLVKRQMTAAANSISRRLGWSEPHEPAFIKIASEPKRTLLKRGVDPAAAEVVGVKERRRIDSSWRWSVGSGAVFETSALVGPDVRAG